MAQADSNRITIPTAFLDAGPSGVPVLPLADAELVAVGAEFRNLLDLFFKARDLPAPCCDDITDAMDPVVDRIMALPATTIAGLAAKAEVVRFFNPAAFSEDDEVGDLGAAVRDLVEAISALAGRSPQDGDIARGRITAMTDR